MTTLGRREKCVRNRVEKEAFPGVACPPDAKPVPSGAAETPWTKPGLKPCRGGRLVYKRNWNRRVTTGIPA
jgi:hypothetical protein